MWHQIEDQLQMPQNFNQYLRTLQALFFALLAGQILATAVLYFIEKPVAGNEIASSTVPEKTMTLALVVLAGLAYFLYHKKVESARVQTGLKEKLSDFRMACILKWAPLEVGTLSSAVLYFLTGKMFFVGMAVTVIAMFASQFPSRQRIITELDLSATEQMTLDDPNEIVAEALRSWGTQFQ